MTTCACGCGLQRATPRSRYASRRCRQRVYERAVRAVMAPSEYGVGVTRRAAPDLLDGHERLRLARAERQMAPIDRLIRDLLLEET